MIKPRSLLWIVFLAAASLSGYLLAAWAAGMTGFPLDDSWIHQTYARSLGWYGEWAYLPGQPSGGSTAPLWSLLLALGYALRLPPLAWTYALGAACLAGLAWAGVGMYHAWAPQRPAAGLWVAVLLALEWHLVWAAASGMETLLFALLIVLVLREVLLGLPHPWRTGLLVGLSIWVRPDGLTLLGPVLMAAWAASPADAPINAFSWSQRWRPALRLSLVLLAGVLLMGLPYLAFNQAVAGSWWPNTFFAKQAEYAIMREAPLYTRLLSLFSLPLVGVGLLLLPGVGLLLLRIVRERQVAGLAVLLWLAGYIALYSLRLPVTYQHGRYLIPAMPIFFIAGVLGLLDWVQPNVPQLLKRVTSRAWVLAVVLLVLGFWVLGLQAYVADVAVIESEMVATAHWLAANTPADTLIAAHDIGALGYFARRPLLDLAGLISPEVIPFIRDEARLADYLDQRQAQYLVTFPQWYPDLVCRALADAGPAVFATDTIYLPPSQGENMTVYRWRPAP